MSTKPVIPFSSTAALPVSASKGASSDSTIKSPTIKIFLDHLCELLEIKSVQEDVQLFKALKNKIRILSILEPSELLQPQERSNYNCSQHLLGQAGQVRRVIKEQFLEMQESSQVSAFASKKPAKPAFEVSPRTREAIKESPAIKMLHFAMTGDEGAAFELAD